MAPNTGFGSWATAARVSSAILTRASCTCTGIRIATASRAIRIAYPWHDQGFHPPAFNDLIIYQFHIGVFFAKDDQGRDIRPGRVSKYLDVVDRIKYLADLGVNAIMPLPFVEFQGENSLGYNGTDLFSPEMDYAVDTADLPSYAARVNRLLAEKNCPPLTTAQLAGQVNQLKALIDLCHLYGLAVIADVVYNHAGGNFDDQSIHFFDRPASADNKDSIYFCRTVTLEGSYLRFGSGRCASFSSTTPSCSSANTTSTAFAMTR